MRGHAHESSQNKSKAAAHEQTAQKKSVLSENAAQFQAIVSLTGDQPVQMKLKEEEYRDAINMLRTRLDYGRTDMHHIITEHGLENLQGKAAFNLLTGPENGAYTECTEWLRWYNSSRAEHMTNLTQMRARFEEGNARLKMLQQGRAEREELRKQAATLSEVIPTNNGVIETLNKKQRETPALMSQDDKGQLASLTQMNEEIRQRIELLNKQVEERSHPSFEHEIASIPGMLATMGNEIIAIEENERLREKYMTRLADLVRISNDRIHNFLREKVIYAMTSGRPEANIDHNDKTGKVGYVIFYTSPHPIGIHNGMPLTRVRLIVERQDGGGGGGGAYWYIHTAIPS